MCRCQLGFFLIMSELPSNDAELRIQLAKHDVDVGHSVYEAFIQFSILFLEIGF